MAIKALIVGINHYLGIEDLSICINDADDWENLFKEKFNVAPEYIQKSSDNSSTLKSNILSHLEQLVASLESIDIGVFIFSGHGSYEVITDDEGIWVEQQLMARDRQISEIEIAEIIKKVPATSQFICILDSCFSGGFHLYRKDLNSDLAKKTPKDKNMILRDVEVKTFKKTPVLDIPENAKFRNTIQLNSMSKNIYTLTASDKEELAYGGKINGRKNSAFSKYLIDEIKKNKAQSYGDLFLKIYQKLPNKELGFNQTPQLFQKDSKTRKTIFN